MTGGKSCAVCKIVGLLVGIGALNWGLVGFFQVDLVAKFLGVMTTPARVVYDIIGIAGVLKLLSLVKCCPCSSSGCCQKK
ncbi:MAG: DUF378 domain-containing protein [Candidatus Omnitrophica bacterium]|nr:DUF378 domain-containing protein [Candidatus Omnitrophota bacterium]